MDMNLYVYMFVYAHDCKYVCERHATSRGDREKYVHVFFGQVLVILVFIHASSVIYFVCTKRDTVTLVVV